MKYEELRDKLFALLNEAQASGTVVDDLMAAVGMVHERTKFVYAMAIRAEHEAWQAK